MLKQKQPRLKGLFLLSMFVVGDSDGSALMALCQFFTGVVKGFDHGKLLLDYLLPFCDFNTFIGDFIQIS